MSIVASRGSSSERGYGTEHKAERERWRPVVDRGDAYCAEIVCLEENDGAGRWIEPGTEWHLAHAEGQIGYRGPAHARCNISEGSRRMHAARAKDKRLSRTRWWRP
jgi:hypothetical protein